MTTELRAAEALLDKGTKVPVTAPLLFRAFGKKFFYPVIRPSYSGTLYRIDYELEKAGLTEEVIKSLEDNQLGMYRKYVKPMSRVVAQGMLNGYFSGKLLARPLAWYLREHMTNVRIIYAVKVLHLLSRPNDFTSSIRLVSRLKMTAPTLSPTEQGS